MEVEIEEESLLDRLDIAQDENTHEDMETGIVIV
jgi:hypothetical protein